MYWVKVLEVDQLYDSQTYVPFTWYIISAFEFSMILNKPKGETISSRAQVIGALGNYGQLYCLRDN